jgi:mitochondrial fission protein ELM1
MHILLKNLLKEVEEKSPLKYQFYCDMDGVLVNLDKGFKAISGGLSPQEYEAKNGKNTFWNVVNKNPNFWVELEPLPDAKVLWDYIKDTFKDPPAVILSAGQGTRIKEQKTAWIRKHIDPSAQVIIASSGVKKPQYIIDRADVRLTHILLDDTDKNITAWENSGENRIAILHKDAASSINKIKQIVSV